MKRRRGTRKRTGERELRGRGGDMNQKIRKKIIKTKRRRERRTIFKKKRMRGIRRRRSGER